MGRSVGRPVGLESENNAHYSLPTGSPFRLSLAKKVGNPGSVDWSVGQSADLKCPLWSTYRLPTWTECLNLSKKVGNPRSVGWSVGHSASWSRE